MERETKAGFPGFFALVPALRRSRVGIGPPQPLGPDAVEVHLHTRVLALALDTQHYALAELGMQYARSQTHDCTFAGRASMRRNARRRTRPAPRLPCAPRPGR